MVLQLRRILKVGLGLEGCEKLGSYIGFRVKGKWVGRIREIGFTG